MERNFLTKMKVILKKYIWLTKNENQTEIILVPKVQKRINKGEIKI